MESISWKDMLERTNKLVSTQDNPKATCKQFTLLFTAEPGGAKVYVDNLTVEIGDEEFEVTEFPAKMNGAFYATLAAFKKFVAQSLQGHRVNFPYAFVENLFDMDWFEDEQVKVLHDRFFPAKARAKVDKPKSSGVRTSSAPQPAAVDLPEADPAWELYADIVARMVASSTIDLDRDLSDFLTKIAMFSTFAVRIYDEAVVSLK